MLIWWVSPLESPWERKLPKVLWKSFCARRVKYAMLASRGSSNIFRECSSGRDEMTPSPAEQIVGHGNCKSTRRASRDRRNGLLPGSGDSAGAGELFLS